MSTAQEIAQGAKENKAIDDESVVIHDPFLTSWVNRIGANLATHRVRRDIVYRFTIIDDQSINAFSIKGGFVHVNVGLLNLVSSDDQLASTLGHEMGHVELHHVTRSSNTSTIIGILETILSVIYMPAAILGSIGSGLAQEKYSRIDELQADKYGLSPIPDPRRGSRKRSSITPSPPIASRIYWVTRSSTGYRRAISSPERCTTSPKGVIRMRAPL
jgi:predicted Zn-dependent protease